MKKAITLVLSSALLVGLWFFMNSNWTVTSVAQFKLQPILEVRVSKADVLDFLLEEGYPASEHHRTYRNGQCVTARSGEFSWNCQHPSYVSTGWSAGVFGLTSPHIQVFFIFDEEERLVRYVSSVSHTFL